MTVTPDKLIYKTVWVLSLRSQTVDRKVGVWDIVIDYKVYFVLVSLLLYVYHFRNKIYAICKNCGHNQDITREIYLACRIQSLMDWPLWLRKKDSVGFRFLTQPTLKHDPFLSSMTKHLTLGKKLIEWS